MLITFLGTSAANAYPEAFCMCKNCKKARALGGESLRKRSSVLVNDDLLIDLGPDIMTSSQMHGISLTKVGYCLQTHPHSDHLDLSHLLSRSPGYGVEGAPRLHFYASRETIARAAETFERDLSSHKLLSPDTPKLLNLEIHTIEPLQPFSFGTYRVIAFPANHAHSMGAMLYSVESEGGTLFYGTDTAVLPEEIWKAFAGFDMRFDAVILDHTYGPEEPGSDHLCAHDVIAHFTRMRKLGLLKPRARLLATHIAHEGNPPHPVLGDFASLNGYEIAFDGLVCQI